MKQNSITLSYKVFDSIYEVIEDFRPLIIAAQDACSLSHAPYSNFRVGSAVRLENAEILKGANQENAAYPMCTCAEQVALYHSAMQYPTIPISALAIHVNVDNKSHHPPSPCGACRQVILEYEQKFGHDIQIFISSLRNEIYHFDSIKQLLPFYFSSDDLSVNIDTK